MAAFGACYSVVELPRDVKMLGATQGAMENQVVITRNSGSANLYAHVNRKTSVSVCEWVVGQRRFTSPVVFLPDLKKYAIVTDGHYLGLFTRKNETLFRLSNNDFTKINSKFKIWRVVPGTTEVGVDSLLLFENWHYQTVKEVMELPVNNGIIQLDVGDVDKGMQKLKENRELLDCAVFKDAVGIQNVLFLATNTISPGATHTTTPIELFAFKTFNNTPELSYSVPSVLSHCILPKEIGERQKVALIDVNGQLKMWTVGQEPVDLCDVGSIIPRVKKDAVTMRALTSADMSLLVMAASSSEGGTIIFCYDLRNNRLVEQKLKSRSKTCAAEIWATTGEFVIMKVGSCVMAQLILEGTYRAPVGEGPNRCVHCNMLFPLGDFLKKHQTSYRCVGFGNIGGKPIFEAYR